MFFPLDSRNTKKVKTKMFINNKRISVNLFEKKRQNKNIIFYQGKNNNLQKTQALN